MNVSVELVTANIESEQLEGRVEALLGKLALSE